MKIKFIIYGFIISIISLSCKKEDIREAETLSIVTNNLEVEAGDEVEYPVSVTIRDQKDHFFEGAIVKFSAITGTVSTATAVSDNEGKANTVWEFIATEGTHVFVIEAFKHDEVTHLSGSPKTIHINGTPKRIASVFELNQANNQLFIQGQSMDYPIRIYVKDQNEEFLQGVTITFSANKGSVLSRSVITDNAGMAETLWKLDDTSDEEQMLTINALEDDGTTVISNSLITVRAKVVEGLTDIDGNIYPALKIGEQIWMGENLKTTKYNDGSSIPVETDYVAWMDLSTPAYSFIDFEHTELYPKYGYFYNGHIIKTDKICPQGWHVPSDEEWKQMEIFLGMEEDEANKTGERGFDQGKKLKGTIQWGGEEKGTNESYFNAIGTGYLPNWMSTPINRGHITIFWTNSLDQNNNPMIRYLNSSTNKIFREAIDENTGCSIRCVKN